MAHFHHAFSFLSRVMPAEVCKYFLQGSCRFGAKCRNQHPGQITAADVGGGGGGGGGFGRAAVGGSFAALNQAQPQPQAFGNANRSLFGQAAGGNAGGGLFGRQQQPQQLFGQQQQQQQQQLFGQQQQQQQQANGLFGRAQPAFGTTAATAANVPQTGAAFGAPQPGLGACREESAVCRIIYSVSGLLKLKFGISSICRLFHLTS